MTISPARTPVIPKSPLVEDSTSKLIGSRQSVLRAAHRPLHRYNSNPEPPKRNHVTYGDGSQYHSKSCRRSRQRDYYSDMDSEHRPRTLSMPSKGKPPKPVLKKGRSLSQERKAPKTDSGGQGPLYRVRSFTSSSRGVINRGDSFKIRSDSVESTGSCPERVLQLRHTWSAQSQTGSSRDSSTASSFDVDTPSSFQVLIMGAAGVGKTALIQQFKTSEYMGNEDPCLGGYFSVKTI